MENPACSLSTKNFYGSGATAFDIKDAGFNYFLLIYYNQVLGLDAFLTGLALAFGWLSGLTISVLTFIVLLPSKNIDKASIHAML